MFENVIGHDKQKNTIINMINSNTFSHAYLFVGKKGIGKKLLANEIAKVLLKNDKLDTCLDYKYISKEEGKKDLSVERIRKELLEDIYIRPAVSDKKVYIIDDAENLNFAAQNALLKTLEEPPSYVHIIMIAESSSSFLSTIISRINIIKFDGIQKESIQKYVKQKYNIEFDSNILDFIQGSIGLAENIINNNLFEKLKKVEEIYSSVIKKDVVKAILNSTENIFSESNMLEYFEYLFYKDGFYNICKFVEKANNRLKNNGNYDIVIDNMIINLIENI